MAEALTVSIGELPLKNPVIAAPGEHLIEDGGLAAAIASGAGAVVMKSTNESDAAKRQLRQAEYAALGPDWRPVAWDPKAVDATILTRSGLHPLGFEAWLDQAARHDRLARASDCLLMPSLVLADLGAAVASARRIEQAGLRVLELNIGTPYASQAARGAVSTELDPGRVSEIVGAVTAAVSIPVWVKLSGQSERVTALAAAATAAGAATVVIAGRALGLVPDLDTMTPHLGTSCGVGGFWNLPLTCHWLAETRAALGPEQPLIGINGATSGEDVARMMLAGATAVGLSSAVMMRGFGVLSDAVAALQAYCDTRALPAAGLIGRAADARRRFSDLPVLDNVWRHHIPRAAGAAH
ncbi:dihydroorotate dehydrogenase [Paracoccus sp. S-4012]|uniref:tRNA-dihydrouridine synthase n=1 Tax=Paracoccus sp. S-4012 TaxID=2665648 RepID=UPI0012B07783|nr:tRNA-dihydrouridine synthase [Paracoccus sp. S-4012]MRX49396.1 dihydroorotate dehydrogenase [Paracoccus sp. S-4012]